jgi:hypothetical protein
MRKQNNGTAAASRKPAGIHQIIFSVGRFYRGCKAQELRVCTFYFSFEIRVGNFARGEDLHFTIFQAEI